MMIAYNKRNILHTKSTIALNVASHTGGSQFSTLPLHSFPPKPDTTKWLGALERGKSPLSNGTRMNFLAQPSAELWPKTWKVFLGFFQKTRTYATLGVIFKRFHFF